MQFPEGFCLSFNETHWSNEAETIRLLKKVIVHYAETTRKKLNLPNDAKVLLIWDVFKAQSCDLVKKMH